MSIDSLFVSQYVEGSPIEIPEQEMTQQEKEAVEKMRRVTSEKEMADIMSDELVRTLMLQIQM